MEALSWTLQVRSALRSVGFHSLVWQLPSMGCGPGMRWNRVELTGPRASAKILKYLKILRSSEIYVL